MDDRPCKCGSGKGCYLLTDARGIPCGYVCEDCEDQRRGAYRPEIFTDSRYECDEPIDDTDD